MENSTKEINKADLFKKFYKENPQSNNKKHRFWVEIPSEYYQDLGKGIYSSVKPKKFAITGDDKENTEEIFNQDFLNFTENASFKFNDFIGIKKGEERDTIFTLLEEKEYGLIKKESFSKIQKSLITFPSNLSNYGIEFEKKEAGKLINLLSKENKTLNKFIKEIQAKGIREVFSKEIFTTQDSADRKIVSIYKYFIKRIKENHNVDFYKSALRESGFIQLGFNENKNHFIIEEGTHRLLAFLELEKEGVVYVSDLGIFNIGFGDSKISGIQNLESLEKDDFIEEIADEIKSQSPTLHKYYEMFEEQGLSY